ncbi:matrixin, partial [Candidatus Nitrosopumilus salaria BD31]
PSIPDKQIPINALKKAIQSWEENNPQLDFIQSENSNIEIKWQKYASSTHTGLATCNSVLFGILSHCVLDISVGAEDCNGNFIQNDENMVINILMHEIGHSLGLGHSSQTDHLMYSTESPQIAFDDKGYVIPSRFEELYVGQNLLLKQEKEIRSEIESLNVKISRENSQYDEYLKQYEYYEGKTLSPDDYQKAQRVFEKLNTQGEKINSMIDDQNMLIEQINDIVNQLGCNPNFEITS